MRDHLVSYLRLLGFSVCTLAVALCTRFATASAATPAPEPRFALPPSQGDMAAAPVLLTEDEAVAELDDRLTALSAEIANLSKALDVLGPLPDHPELFIPVAMSALENPAPASENVRPYSPLASTADTVADMRRASLGALSVDACGADLGCLQPGYDLPSHIVDFNLELSEDEALAALCVELSAVSGPPRMVAPIRAWW
jgi:hypothetical protein